MTLGDFRAAVAAALDVDPEVAVHDGPVDSVSPPAYLLLWPDQNLAVQTHCYYRARLQVVCVGARVEPTPGYDALEQLVARAVVLLTAAGFQFEPVGAYLPEQIGGVQYLSARIIVATSLTLEAPSA